LETPTFGIDYSHLMGVFNIHVDFAFAVSTANSGLPQEDVGSLSVAASMAVASSSFR